MASISASRPHYEHQIKFILYLKPSSQMIWKKNNTEYIPNKFSKNTIFWLYSCLLFVCLFIFLFFCGCVCFVFCCWFFLLQSVRLFYAKSPSSQIAQRQIARSVTHGSGFENQLKLFTFSISRRMIIFPPQIIVVQTQQGHSLQTIKVWES